MMFYNCESLINIDLNGFNTQNVRNISKTFTYSESLISLDISSFQTSNIIDMNKVIYKILQSSI